MKKQVFSILAPKYIKIVKVLGGYSVFRFCNCCLEHFISDTVRPSGIPEKTLGMLICQVNSLDKFEEKLVFSLGIGTVLKCGHSIKLLISSMFYMEFH